MHRIRLLPTSFTQRYLGWRATVWTDNQAWYRRLAQVGQHPRSMIISCCDSRVHATSIFGADEGEFFVHRNIANLVPPHNLDGEYHGTSAAVEYAVSTLKVAHVIVLGHSGCGGVKGCLDMCCDDSTPAHDQHSYVERWMDILRPGYERVKHLQTNSEQQTALELQSVLISLENLMTFPFIRAAVDAGELTLHGLWNDISNGGLKQYDAKTRTFVPI